MRNYCFTIFAVFISIVAFAQQQEKLDVNEVDSLYREDQFYLGVSVNWMTELPKNVSQSGLSGGVYGGFIRDMPINKRRNIALGLGLGLAANTYGHNLFIGKDDTGNTIFEAINSNQINYDTNRFATYILEVPLEFRWRTSTPTTNSFYRIYAGVTFGYMYYFRSNFQQEEQTVRIANVDELNRFRADLSLTLGNNVINFNIKYSLNPLFDTHLTDSKHSVSINNIKFGFVFYIL
ncbi:MAG: outer membrane beta-barrel protein [Bacteroidota bacterium]